MSESNPANEPPREPSRHPFHYVHSEGFPAILESLGASLLVTTYQAGKLVAIRARQGRVSTLFRTFDKAMGLAVDQRRLAIATQYQVWVLRNAPDIGRQLEPVGLADACYVPRWSHVTGDIHCHEIGWAHDELWLVNTRFSCLCTLDSEYSFVPRWRPTFVTALAAEDRCHLNGLEIVGGQPAYVTALGQTDTEEGWRENKASGGCLIDVRSGEVIAQGLCMPHSPRVHDGRVWLLDSGTGRLVTVEPATGRAESVVALPGYARGLALCGGLAFVGLSKVRESAIFGGMPIVEKLGELRCGIWVVETAGGRTVAFLEFQAGVEEIFDVRVLTGIRYPAVIGLQKETIHGTFVVPPI
jgi:uncharacterized protein (TIGR03032 family)